MKKLGKAKDFSAGLSLFALFAASKVICSYVPKLSHFSAKAHILRAQLFMCAHFVQVFTMRGGRK